LKRLLKELEQLLPCLQLLVFGLSLLDCSGNRQLLLCTFGFLMSTWVLGLVYPCGLQYSLKLQFLDFGLIIGIQFGACLLVVL
jgi:hypothetical protein